MNIRSIVEALLFASKSPLTVKDIQSAFHDETPAEQDIKSAVAELSVFYQNSAIELKEVASGYRFQIRPDYSSWINSLNNSDKPPKYSRAMLETLAVIAYRQPVTRQDIADIRGVDDVSSNTLGILQRREWIKVIGTDEGKGHAQLFGTTRKFLDYFNLSSLDELPSMDTLLANSLFSDNLYIESGFDEYSMETEDEEEEF